jgi:hypothetical protein
MFAASAIEELLSCGLHDAVAGERAGTPSVAITTGFVDGAELMSSALGLPAARSPSSGIRFHRRAMTSSETKRPTLFAKPRRCYSAPTAEGHRASSREAGAAAPVGVHAATGAKESGISSNRIASTWPT